MEGLVKDERPEKGISALAGCTAAAEAINLGMLAGLHRLRKQYRRPGQHFPRANVQPAMWQDRQSRGTLLLSGRIKWREKI